MEEIYEPAYFDPETGKICQKENIIAGIPQGPDLSAYLANIVLFDLDKTVLDYVNEENQNAKEGKIRIRYARYVDDMVIIASDADCLIYLKSLISSMLFDKGLFLSPKTDQADNITKEEAFDWTISEKGGLGVSAIYAFVKDENSEMEYMPVVQGTEYPGLMAIETKRNKEPGKYLKRIQFIQDNALVPEKENWREDAAELNKLNLYQKP